MLYHTPQLVSSQPFYAPLPSFTPFFGHNYMSGHKYLKFYNSYDIYCANLIINYRYYTTVYFLHNYEDVIGASVSEPPLVDSTDALSRYIRPTRHDIYIYIRQARPYCACAASLLHLVCVAVLSK